jgi:Holliday junction resolvase RusA-like endonuclease
MNDSLQYRINIEGFPCLRPRLGKYGVYNPTKYTNFKTQTANLLTVLNIPKKDYEYIHIRFYFSYPQYFAKSKRIDNAPMRGKYDIDNLVKAFFDAVQQAKIVHDDRVFSAVYAEKLYTTENFGWIEFEFQ